MNARVSLFLAAGMLTADDRKPPPAPEAKPQPTVNSVRRTELNLLGRTDTQSGESRRNENIHFNPIDNNALKELNLRIGATATLVEEFRADRSWFSAEFGNRPTGPVHLGSLAKTAAVHGSLFAGHNNSVFSARSFFQVGGVEPARENEWGFALVMPLGKQTAVSLDGSQQRIGGVVNGNALVPTPGERTPLATDPAVRRVVERMLAAYPRIAPNRTDIDPRALNLNSPQSVATDNATLRLDQNHGQRDRYSFRYTFTGQQVDAFQFVAGQNPNTHMQSHAAHLTWNRAWSASTTAAFTAGFERTHSRLVPESNAVGPSVSFGGALTSLGPDSGLPVDRAQNRFRYAAEMRQTRGLHDWSAGADVARLQTNGAEVSSHRGVFMFRNDFGRDAITNFRMGVPSRFSVGLGDTHRGFRQWLPSFYADDRWRAASRLTLHYGVRVQPVLGPAEVSRRTVVPYDSDLDNIAARAGFALRLSERLGVMRAAYGTHFGEIFPTTFQQLRWNPPAVLKFEIPVPPLVDPLGAISGASFDPNARSTIFVVPSDLRTPYSHHYNFSWEPGLARHWRLQLGYVGSRSQKLLLMWNTNRARPTPGIPQTTATVTERRSDPRHHEIRRVTNSSRGYYDAARVSLVMPGWHGLSAEAAYWWSKAIDLGANYTNTAAGDDSRQGRSQGERLVLEDLKGLSTFDQPHSFLARVSWSTPKRRVIGSWTVSAVTLLKSGTPFSVLSGSDAPGFGNVDGASGDRPDVIDASVLGQTIGHPDSSQRLLARSAFAFMHPTQERGNLGTNTFRRSPIRNLNAALARTWSLGAEKSLTLRAESINLLNTPQFAEPTLELASPSFGAITNTLNDGRAFQFQLRFRF